MRGLRSSKPKIKDKGGFFHLQAEDRRWRDLFHKDGALFEDGKYFEAREFFEEPTISHLRLRKRRGLSKKGHMFDLPN